MTPMMSSTARERNPQNVAMLRSSGQPEKALAKRYLAQLLTWPTGSYDLAKTWGPRKPDDLCSMGSYDLTRRIIGLRPSTGECLLDHLPWERTMGTVPRNSDHIHLRLCTGRVHHCYCIYRGKVSALFFFLSLPVGRRPFFHLEKTPYYISYGVQVFARI